ncbi:uncharacterized protein LOC103988584 [Musa acuminata AAA Group]|uniref:uncharacterized protein LOC103988584 n=1 Tax=Musa acuminata AAA Group TaxID=214697 RepID=UPI0031E39583
MERSQIWFALRCLILALLLSWAVADDNVFVLRFALGCLILALLLSLAVADDNVFVLTEANFEKEAVADDNVFVLTEANFEKEVGQRLRPQVRPL